MIERVVTTKSSSELEITYWPTDICNFNCPYCFPGSTEGKYRYPKDLDSEIKKFKKLFNTYSSKTKFNLTIAGGGEPTLWPNLGDFCKQVKTLANVSITIVSNASRTLSWWSRHAEYIDGATLSCHVHDVDIDHFVSVADMLFENNVNVVAMMLMDAKEWDKCVAYIDIMLQSKLPWTIEAKDVVSSKGRDVDSYTSEQLEFIKQPIKRLEPSDRILSHLDDYNHVKSVELYSNGTAKVANTNKYINSKENYFEGWSCSMPLERIAILPSGEVKGSCGLTFDINNP